MDTLSMTEVETDIINPDQMKGPEICGWANCILATGEYGQRSSQALLAPNV